MTDIELADVTIHIDNAPGIDTRRMVENGLRDMRGVVSVHLPEDKPHLLVVEYDPNLTEAHHLLVIVRELAGHAEMIGL